MAHEVENMMFVGQVPWHGLGVKVDECIGTEEAIIKAGLDWGVETTPAFAMFHHPETGVLMQKELPAMATVRSTDKKILGVVGKDYKVLQDRDAFKFFDRFLTSGHCTLECAGSLREGKRVWVLAKVKNVVSEIVKNDPVEMYLLLSNSHDGTLAIRVGFTPIRVVCANTLNIAIHSGVSQLLRIQHKGDVNGALDSVSETIDIVRREFSTTAEKYKMLASKGINEDDLKKYVKVVFHIEDAKKRKQRILAGEGQPTDEEIANEDGAAKIFERIELLFYMGRGNNMPGVRDTWWAAYNAVTEYTSHVRGGDRAIRLESQWMGDGARINQKALNVALNMAMGVGAN